MAGLSLAYHLINSSLRDRSILIVDRDTEQQNDRTWCFWEEPSTLFDEITYRVWHRQHDSILPNILTHHHDDLKPLFTLMFRNNPSQRIFRFLDETASFAEEVRFIASLPPWRFLQALFRWQVRCRV